MKLYLILLVSIFSLLFVPSLCADKARSKVSDRQQQEIERQRRLDSDNDEEDSSSSSSSSSSSGSSSSGGSEITEEEQEIKERLERKKRRESGATPRASRHGTIDTPEVETSSSSGSVSTEESSSTSDSSSEVTDAPAISSSESLDDATVVQSSAVAMSDPWSDNFLVLLRAHEGVSHWRYVVNDFFLLAMDTNRTLVEPCVKNGVIAPCMHLMSNETLTLSTIIDMAIIKNHFPELRIINWAEYSTKYMHEVVGVMCYKEDSKGFDKSVLDFDSEVIKPASSEGGDKTYEDCVRSVKNFGNTVYIHSPWKHETLRRGLALTMTIPWKYAPFQHTIATRIMKDAKIDLDRYFVFNWRMEGVAKKHLLACSKMLVALSEEWLEKFDGDRLNAMIVTDVSFSKADPLWGDMTNPSIADIQSNVTHQLETNFFKIETSNAVKGTIKQFPRYRDPIFLTIWEIIIAEKALLFVTCAKQNEVCDYCTRIKSKFSEDIIRDRYVAKLNSYESWHLSTYSLSKPVTIAEFLADESPV